MFLRSTISSKYFPFSIRKSFHSLIIGAPGAGKGTISEKILTNFNIPSICAGDVLRNNVKNKTKIGLDIEDILKTGALLPDNLINNLMLKEMKSFDGDSWLLDGYPRTLVQASFLGVHYSLNSVLYINVPFDVIADRISKRWVHEKSGRVYNLDFKPPKTPGVDDVTGEALVQRKDDQPDVIVKRLKVFKEETAPLIEFYSNIGILHEFAGESTPEIWPKIEAFLSKTLQSKISFNS